MDNLKAKTLRGVYWSFFDHATMRGIPFLVGIVLARILEPRDFGLIGMLTIFIAISQAFVESGFPAALVRKKDCSEEDFSTVFYFNLGVSLLFSMLLFIFSGLISDFFSEPQLKALLQVLSLGIVFDAFGTVQRTILIKKIDFKTQTKISVFSGTISGIFAILMAYQGYGVWSLVALTIVGNFIRSLLLWIKSEWMPKLIFSLDSFMDLFGFGGNMLLIRLLDTTFRNIYFFVIGKYFSADILGQYTRAEQFNTLPSQRLERIIEKVSYPVLAQLQDDRDALKAAYKRLIPVTMFVTFLLMFLLAATAKPLIVFLIGSKWLIASEYLQMLCFVGMFYPLHSLNLNILKVKGRSDLFLKIEIIKKIFVIPAIIIGIIFGIKILIIGMFVNALIAYYLNSFWSGKFANYSMKEQISDLLPSLFFSIAISVPVFLLGLSLPLPTTFILFSQLLVALILLVILGEGLKMKEYLYIKKIVINKIKTIKQ